MIRSITLVVLSLAPLLGPGCASRHADDLALDGNLAGALDAYATADTYESHLKMGMIFQSQDDHRDAIAQFSRAEQQNTEADFRIYQYRAESHLALEQRDEALRDLEEALRRNPRIAQVHFLLGNIHLEQGRFSEARVAYTRALAEAGHHPELASRILKNRAMAAFRDGAYDRSAADFEAALQTKGSVSREDRYQLGLLLYAAGRENEAREAWSGVNENDARRLRELLDENVNPGF